MRNDHASAQAPVCSDRSTRRSAPWAQGLILGCAALLAACGGGPPTDDSVSEEISALDGDCVGRIVGSPITCNDEASLKMKAAGVCAALGKTPVNLAFAQPCGSDTYHFAKFQCCTVP